MPCAPLLPLLPLHGLPLPLAHGLPGGTLSVIGCTGAVDVSVVAAERINRLPSIRALLTGGACGRLSSKATASVDCGDVGTIVAGMNAATPLAPRSSVGVTTARGVTTMSNVPLLTVIGAVGLAGAGTDVM